MASTYRLVVHCDENATDRCLGLVEYAAPDRLGLAEQGDAHVSQSGWLRGYRVKNTYDVCPACRPAVEQAMSEHTRKEVING